MSGTVVRSATIWSGALQAAATALGQLKGEALWGSTPSQQASNTANRIVELAAHIIVQMPDDPESGVLEAKGAAKQFLKNPPA